MTKPADLVQGTLDLLILRTIALEPMHRWGIAQRIRQVSKEVLPETKWRSPALQRLGQQAWICAKWGESENNRRAKYYSLTPDGTNICAASERNGSDFLWRSIWCWRRLKGGIRALVLQSSTPPALAVSQEQS